MALGQKRGHLPPGRDLRGSAGAGVTAPLPRARELASASLLFRRRGPGTCASPDLNRWPLFQCPTSLGSAPLRVLENVQRKQEAAWPVQGTGVGWFVSPGLTLQPKDYFPQAVTRRADTCCPFIWEVLIFANRDARISSREGFANLFSAPGDGVQCFLPQCPHLTPHLLLLWSSLPWCLLAERGFACAVWCLVRRQAALCRRACGVNRRACGVNWHPSVQLLRG